MTRPLIHPPRLTAKELQSYQFPDRKYVVDEILPAGLSLLCAKPKIGKSWLALHIATQVSVGGQVLGRFNCEQGNVLYLALEDGFERIQKRLERIAAPVDERLSIQTSCLRADRGGIKEIEDWIASVPNPKLVVIDTYGRFKSISRGRANAYDEDTAAIAPIQSLAIDRGISILVIHHVRKADGEDWVDTINGTTGLGGVADCIFLLSRHRSQREAVLKSTGRDIGESEYGLVFDSVICLWLHSGEPVGFLGSPQVQREVLTILRDEPQGLTSKAIAERTARTPSATINLLKAMCNGGTIAQTGGRGSKYVMVKTS